MSVDRIRSARKQLAADHGIILHHDAPRKPGLGRHHHVTPDAAIMAHVHHVVQFSALANKSDAQRGTVYAGICANFHKIADAHKGKVKLTFAHGASLPDPDKLFNAGLEGNTRRAIDFFRG